MAKRYRRGSLSELVGTLLGPNVGCNVTVYEPGAIASGAPTGATVPVYAGHGFAALDWLIVGTDITTLRQVLTANPTSLVLNATVPTVYGSVLVNLGADTGAIAPAFDGSTVDTWTDPNGDVLITAPEKSTIVTGARGNYEYWWDGTPNVWEVLHKDGAVIDVIRDIWGAGGGLSATPPSVDNTLARFDGTGANAIQGTGIVVNDTDDVTGVNTLAVDSNATVGGTLDVTGTLTADGAASIAGQLDADGISILSGRVDVGGHLRLIEGVTPPTITIAAGVATLSTGRSNILLAGEGGVADDLDTITTIGSEYRSALLMLEAADDAVTITVKHNTGNILLVGGADFALDSARDKLLLFKDGSNWVELVRVTHG